MAKKMGLPLPSAPRVSYWEGQAASISHPYQLGGAEAKLQESAVERLGLPFPSMPTPRCRNPATGMAG